MDELFTELARQDNAPSARRRFFVPCGQISCVVGVIALGCIAVTPAATAESSDKVERAARLVEDEKSDPGGLRLAQNVDDGFAVGEVSGPAATPIPISVRVPEIEGGYNFLVFRNLPKDFEMSAGFPVEDQWVVPLDQVEDLSVKAPENYRGSFRLEIKLRIGGTDKSQTLQVPVNIVPPGAGQRSAEAATRDTRKPKGLSAEKEQAMLKRAEAFLKTRDVAAARMIYEYLAQKGSGEAAYGMARTYDPAYVEEIGVAGMNAQDVDQAKQWYERAALLGHQEAQDRLKIMAAGTQ